MRITGPVSISVDGTTVSDVCIFAKLCKITGVPGDTPVRVRTSLGGKLRRISVLTADGAMEVAEPSNETERVE